MPDARCCQAVSYQCAHCKQISSGEPTETAFIEGHDLPMCCLGCVCAAELLLSLRRYRITADKTSEH